jgi:phosphoribosyl 1,2-cyclic phosphodiesterase
VKVRLWGTRGSHAMPGPDTVAYGGHTACVEVRGGGGEVLVLDGGTGMQPLGRQLAGEPGRVDVLLTHLHMDHIQGLGFFAPFFQPGREVHIWGPASARLTLEARLRRYFSPPLFPVLLRDLPCDLRIHDLAETRFRVGQLDVRSDLVCHPGAALGYRIGEGESTVAYLPDHEPALGTPEFPREPEWTSGYALMEGVDVLVHDAQYTDEEYAMRVGWGHSTFAHTVAIAELAGVGRLVTFHHDPNHTDAFLDVMHERLRAKGLPFELVAGREGMEMEV